MFDPRSGLTPIYFIKIEGSFHELVTCELYFLIIGCAAVFKAFQFYFGKMVFRPNRLGRQRHYHYVKWSKQSPSLTITLDQRWRNTLLLLEPLKPRSPFECVASPTIIRATQYNTQSFYLFTLGMTRTIFACCILIWSTLISSDTIWAYFLLAWQCVDLCRRGVITFN